MLVMNPIVFGMSMLFPFFFWLTIRMMAFMYGLIYDLYST